jgi:dihydrofolate synthase/folylpolyglutamate synthase
MTYEEALAFLTGRGRFGELGLSRIRRVLERLGHPEDRYPIAHIAGTNGKGSTAAFLEAILRADGRRVGLFTSPHLVSPRERIQVDRRPIPKADLAELTRFVRDVALVDEPDPATEFELWTAIGLLHFARAGVDAAVVEVGLGGRYDATNAIRRPRVTAVVTVGMDHMDRLGPTLRHIAREKAGIIKPDVPVVVGDLPPEAMAVVLAAARERGAPVARLGHEIPVEGGRGEGGRWYLAVDGERVPLGLPGPHQLGNAALAAAMARHFGVGTAAIRRGLAAAHWPGRLDRRLDGRLWLDGAHNPDGAQALARALADLGEGQRFHIVFGCLADRDPAALLTPLLPFAATVTAVTVDSTRALPATAIARVVPEARTGTLAETLARVRERPEPTLVTGSLYLIGEALALLGEGDEDEVSPTGAE